ncbi:MAG: hypothetical protein GX483_03165 [Actinomycetaceae bacterium]|nr:hypothetical protein [Actinomycetaceae bacterium]
MGIADWGFDEEPEPEAQRGPSKQFIFMVAAAVFALIIGIIALFTLLIGTGAHLAEPKQTASSETETTEPTQPTDSEPAQTPSTAEEELAAALNTASTLWEHTSCNDPVGDAAIINAVVDAALAGNAWNIDVQNQIFDALSDLDAACSTATDKSYVSALHQELVSGSDARYELYPVIAGATWVVPAKPASSSAVVPADAFTTPVENIRCMFGNDRATCTIAAYNWDVDSQCSGKPMTFVVDEYGNVTSGCTTAPVTGGTVYHHGTELADSGFACSLDQSSFTCWNEIFGGGFELSRQNSRIF